MKELDAMILSESLLDWLEYVRILVDPEDKQGCIHGGNSCVRVGKRQ